MTDETNNGTQANEQAAPAPGVATTQEFTFFFRTDKVRDDEGKVIGNGRKHPDVKAVLPIPTFADLAAAISEGGKVAQMVLESVTEQIYSCARMQINEFREAKGLDKDFTASDFDLSKLSLAAIANMPKSERGGPAISDEDWTAFLDDYAHVMVHSVGYEERKVKLAVAHFKVQLRRVKNDKPSVQKLLDLLNIWATKTEALEDHVTCYEDLVKRANKYLNAEDKNLSEAL